MHYTTDSHLGKGWRMEEATDRPESLGKRSLRRKIPEGIRAWKGCHVCQGVWRAMCMSKSEYILRKSMYE